MKPFDMVAMRTETKERFQINFDRYNDSYTEDIQDNEEMERILDKMELQLFEKLLEREVVEFENEHLGGSGQFIWSLFSDICGFFWDGETKAGMEREFFSNGRGIIVDDLKEATHVFVKDAKDKGAVKGLPNNVRLLSVNYIVKCIMEGRLLEETPFLVPA